MTSFIIAIILFYILEANIVEITKALSNLYKNKVNARLFLSNNNFFKDIADEINTLNDYLMGCFKIKDEESLELKSIIDSLQNIFFLIDQDEKIILYNNNFQTQFNFGKIKNPFYWEIIRNQDILNLVKAMQRNLNKESKEINIGNKTFLLSASKIAKNSFISIMLYDITSIKELEKIKRDFVANVSHELKTPLTSVKGFLETIDLEKLDQEQQKYFAIITRNIDRMALIIQDLLALSSLEAKSIKDYNFQKINIVDLLKNINNLFREKLNSKNITLSLENFPSKALVYGDEFLLEQLFINLIDNAIKYSEAGTIKVSNVQKDGKLVLVIKDQGIGIPKNSLAYIFDRFYVVDKSRAKQKGGTGLGLSIVKHIASIHNIEIKVESDFGEGTSFFLAFP